MRCPCSPARGVGCPGRPKSFREGRRAAGECLSRPAAGMQLHTIDSTRKYLTAGERDLFLKTPERRDRDVHRDPRRTVRYTRTAGRRFEGLRSR